MLSFLLLTNMNQSQKKEQKRTVNKSKNTKSTDKSVTDDIVNENNNNNNHGDGPQSALVLQGGGALAAYEVGVFGVLYFWRRKGIDEKNSGKDTQIFDVISGTSGGAINGWLVLDHVMGRINQGYSVSDSWKGSFKKLLDFWDHTSSSPDFTKWGPFSFSLEVGSVPGFPPYAMWNWTSDEMEWMSRWERERQKISTHVETGEAKELSIATGEAARRYYSSKQYLYSGAENVFSRLPIEHDNRFFDNTFPPSNTWNRYNNQPLRSSIEKFSKLKSLATTFFNDSIERSQPGEKIALVGPRLLVIAVDVEKGQDITFDSYEKEDGVRKTVYHEYDDNEDNKENQSSPSPSSSSFTLTYDKGITLDHVMASASVPVNYDYALVPINTDKSTMGKKEFWDGGILSNTPFRELIQAHEDYWKARIADGASHHDSHEVDDNGKKNNNDIPSLEVYIANIWPSKWKDVPLDLDAVRDRKYDLTYKDKTLQEEKIAYLIYDYIELARKLKDFASSLGSTEDDINEYLNQNLKTKSKHRNGNPRTHQELLRNKVEITKMIRIERHYDPDDISYKWCDYSRETVSHMIEHGIEEALEHIIKREENESRHYHLFDKRNELEKFINLIDREKEAEGLARKETRILTKPAADLLKEAAVKIIQSST